MTDTWEVRPSGPLSGDVEVAGSKNAVTKHMVAALLADTPSTINNVPDVGDVTITASILRSLGVGVERSGKAVTIDPSGPLDREVSVEYTGLNRISILLLGPLVHRSGEAFVPMPGGDKIGRRPIDFHVDALTAFGATVEETEKGVIARASRLRGARIDLPYPSVMATEAVLITASLAEGRTVLTGAATEPEVLELALFLQRMGAQIQRQPGRRFVIDGVSTMHGASTTLAGDRLEAFSYLVAGLISGGQVRVKGCPQASLTIALTTLQSMGADLQITDEYVAARQTLPLQSVAIHTDTHPGFATDWQSPLLVLMTQAEGMSVLHETVFEDRVKYPADVIDAMGGEIEMFNTCLGGPNCRFADRNAKHSVVVKGISKLVGAEVEIPDVRAGFSGVIAASVADGMSRISGVRHLERGYDNPFDRLSGLGLDLARM
ncbi:UDP-N-acetylglucosamine 1-carboxyvinyltransferase [Euzebya tangerina]|uniref:UDP-N-acetylglucosamine 1-carboxyvinyltransferase n=1 Tax=Euzebya tangerina TaxID=591198 RepID=UPI000E31DAE9|nr:UDP-N-acetylglucosamine 1-carboxyvinyltransferase [Euzebya tangerina]